MSVITLSSELSLTLAQLQDRAELYSADGQLLGTFEPCLSEADRKLAEQLRRDGYPRTVAEYKSALAEVQRAIDDPEYARDWKTTQEVLDGLKSRP